ncbi:MAG TPA: cytochrome c biogenesis protein ResB [Terriglobales bacterium]|nr:cytochrome c biogenesis protein ResB [Terriglobales bacterium]
MAAQNPLNKLLRTLSSIKTGVVLLILVVIASAIGTFVLQRPTSEADQIERTYSPAVLHWLDKLGLTDVFHAWWYVLLLTLVAVSIVLVSIDRFPRAWKVLTKPYKVPDSHFRAVLPVQEKFRVTDGDAALGIAERAFRKVHLDSERVGPPKETSLFAERNRYSVLAVYIIHASLLLIFLGGIVDALAGYKGFLMLTKGQTVSQMELSNKNIKQLPFSIRFDDGGRENYADGSPKKWWSDLTVLEDGKEVMKKQIVVNDPLVYKGVRFYQSSFGSSGQVESLTLGVTSKADPKFSKDVTIFGKNPSPIDDDATVELVQFIPDFAIEDGHIYTRSMDPVNPAVELKVVSKKNGTSGTWIFPADPQAPKVGDTPYEFAHKGGKLAPFTGLSVSHEPGQYGVWGGVLLMAIGLGMAFYAVHRRYWAAVVADPKLGLVLWVGMQADKNREHYQEEFQEITDYIRAELQLQAAVENTDKRSLAHA